MHPKTIVHTHKSNLLALHQERQNRQQQVQARVRQEASRLAAILVQEFGAQAVYAFGPLTYGQFTEGMPLEFAVEGLSAEGIVRALAHLKQMSAFQIEITAVHHLDSWTRKAMVRKGILLAQDTA